MTAKEFYLSKHPQALSDLNMTGHDDDFMFKMMDEYAKEQYNQAIRDAAESAEMQYIEGGYYTLTEKQSILKLLK